MRLFWTRRFLRIFPLYYVYILVGTVIVLVTGGFIPGLSYWLYVQNYALAFDPEPLHWTSHLWSLAIEEQFYFVWPLFALLAPRRFRVPCTLLAIVACVVARAGLALSAAHAADPEHALTLVKLAYRATPTHMDGLLLGALMAMFAVDGEHPLARAWVKVRPLVTALAALAVLGLGRRHARLRDLRPPHRHRRLLPHRRHVRRLRLAGRRRPAASAGQERAHQRSSARVVDG